MDKDVVLEAEKVYEHRSGGQYKCLDVMILSRLVDTFGKTEKFV